ncbi:MAG: homoserine kinase [Terriglobales bacterium]
MTGTHDELDLRFPATSANLGPAFDTAALALNLHLRVQARAAVKTSIEAKGRDVALCSKLENHLIIAVYRQTLAAHQQHATPLALRLENQIPIGKGCGSSAAARLAGVALAVRFGGLGWSAQQVFELAAQLEGHPDNAAACWWGGLTVAQAQASDGWRWQQVDLATAWPLLLAVPPKPLATSRARKLLPARYRRESAVANIQNAVMLIQALQHGRGELLAAAFADHMHQPFRAVLCPLWPILEPLAGQSGILGCALSGAGPSVLMVIRDAASMQEAKTAAQAALDAASAEAELIETTIEVHGPGLEWHPR